MSSSSRAPVRRPLLVALFVVYLVLLVWVVLWKLEVPWVGDDRVVKLVPFVATPDAGASSNVEVAANLALFLPFGVYLGLLRPAWPWWLAGGAVGAASAVLEGAQFVLAVGRTDVTDVVANTAGGLAGLVVLGLVHRSLPGRATRVLTTACSLGTVVVLACVALYLASPLHLVHLVDVGPLARTAPVE